MSLKHDAANTFVQTNEIIRIAGLRKMLVIRREIQRPMKIKADEYQDQSIAAAPDGFMIDESSKSLL